LNSSANERIFTADKKLNRMHLKVSFYTNHQTNSKTIRAAKATNQMGIEKNQKKIQKQTLQ
jgi:hypothetical protein